MAERNATLTSTVEALLGEKKYSTIKDVLVTMEPADGRSATPASPRSSVCCPRSRRRRPSPSWTRSCRSC